jgi:hypothetical protein
MYRSNPLLGRFDGNPGADLASIRDFESSYGVTLPSDYVEFLRDMNGGEGVVGSAYVSLWPLAELGELNAGYEVRRWAPGLLLIGSDGGGEGFALDLTAATIPVVMIPFVGMDRSEARRVAHRFRALFDELSKRSS